MGTYFTAIAVGADADAATFNAPMTELDTQLISLSTEIANARGSQSSLDGRLDTALTEAGAIATGAVSAQSQVNLGDAAAANGDAIRYQEFTDEHAAGGAHDEVMWHKAVFVDRTIGGANGVAAATLPTYEYDDPGITADEVKCRFVFQKMSSGGHSNLEVHAEVYVDDVTQPSYLKLGLAGSDEKAEITATAWGTFYKIELDISGLAAGLYAGYVALRWESAAASGDTIHMRYVTVFLNE